MSKLSDFFRVKRAGQNAKMKDELKQLDEHEYRTRRQERQRTHLIVKIAKNEERNKIAMENATRKQSRSQVDNSTKTINSTVNRNTNIGVNGNKTNIQKNSKYNSKSKKSKN